MSLVPTVLGTSCVERRISLAEFHAADEVFTTGTMGELTPVREIDGRLIGPDGTGQPGPVIRRLQEAYKDLTNREGVPLPPFTTADY
jgi:branched-subunit amino acid aminotransferase/4-amino-4-deoxychorismate lyase